MSKSNPCAASEFCTTTLNPNKLNLCGKIEGHPDFQFPMVCQKDGSYTMTCPAQDREGNAVEGMVETGSCSVKTQSWDLTPKAQAWPKSWPKPSTGLHGSTNVHGSTPTGVHAGMSLSSMSTSRSMSSDAYTLHR